MKKLFLFLILIAFGFSSSKLSAQERDYYQVKIFKIKSESQEASLDAYLESAYLPALHKAGIKHVGVFKPIEGKNETDPFILVFIPFSTLQEFELLDAKLKADKTYQENGKAYIEAAHDNPPYERIESMLLRGFKSMPQYAVPDLKSKPAERVYEFRSYEGATEFLYERKVEMFDDAGETALFKKLNFNPLFFAEVISSAHMPHLVYMVCFENEAAHQNRWDAFRTSPEWDQMKNMERYANTVSSITNYLMHPTDYSDL